MDPRGRRWRELKSDPDARFDHEVEIDAGDIAPQVTWGTSPEMVVRRRRRGARPGVRARHDAA